MTKQGPGGAEEDFAVTVRTVLNEVKQYKHHEGKDRLSQQRNGNDK